MVRDYIERETLTNEQFYDLLANATEVPVTSQITSFRYLEEYKKYMKVDIRKS